MTCCFCSRFGNDVGHVGMSIAFHDHHVRIRTDVVSSLEEFASSHHDGVRRVVTGITQSGCNCGDANERIHPELCC